MHGEHHAQDRRHACHQPAEPVQPVDRVHHAHEPEDGERPHQPPGQAVRSKEEAGGEGVVDVLDEDQPHARNQRSPHLRQVLRAAGQLVAIIHKAHNHAKEAARQEREQPPQFVGVVARGEPRCPGRRDDLRQEQAEQDGEEEAAEDGEAARARDDALVQPPPAGTVHHAQPLAQTRGQGGQGQGQYAGKSENYEVEHNQG